MVHLLVYFFPTVIQSCLLCQHLLQCKGHLPSLQDCLVQPCHGGFHLLSHTIQFSWEQTCIALFFLCFAYLLYGSVCSVLGFLCLLLFDGSGIPQLPAGHWWSTAQHLLLKQVPSIKISASSHYQKTIFPQPVFSQHLPHLHIQLLLLLLLNLTRNNPLLGTNTLVGVLFHLPLDGQLCYSSC